MFEMARGNRSVRLRLERLQLWRCRSGLGGDGDVRASFEYYQYYHDQRPLDPRLPPPLVSTDERTHSLRLAFACGGSSMLITHSFFPHKPALVARARRALTPEHAVQLGGAYGCSRRRHACPEPLDSYAMRHRWRRQQRRRARWRWFGPAAWRWWRRTGPAW